MKEDIDKVFPKSMQPFIEIQKERLNLFENNINKQYKFTLEL